MLSNFDQVLKRSSLQMNENCRETDTGNGQFETVPSNPGNERTPLITCNVTCYYRSLCRWPGIKFWLGSETGVCSATSFQRSVCVFFGSPRMTCLQLDLRQATPGGSPISRKIKTKPLTQIFIISMTFATPAPAPAVGITDRDTTAACPVRERAGPCGQQRMIG